jgi:hypothetical protein
LHEPIKSNLSYFPEIQRQIPHLYSAPVSMFYWETQVHVAGGANEARYPVRQDGFDSSTQTPNSTATSATANPSRSFMSVSRFLPSVS